MAKNGIRGKVEYRKEFFDREYSMREAYARVWKYARKYKLRLAIGVICGMATAGTLVPFFQIVQPALQHVESHDAEVEAVQVLALAVDEVDANAVKRRRRDRDLPRMEHGEHNIPFGVRLERRSRRKDHESHQNFFHFYSPCFSLLFVADEV